MTYVIANCYADNDDNNSDNDNDSDNKIKI